MSVIKLIERLSSSICEHEYPRIHYVCTADIEVYWVLLHRDYDKNELIHLTPVKSPNDKCPKCKYHFDAIASE